MTALRIKIVIAVTVFYLVLMGMFAAMLFSSSTPAAFDDGLRHITIAEKYLDSGFDVSWGDFFFSGYFSTHPIDPWFFSDLLYIPFSKFSDRIVGLKLATLAFLSCLIGSFIFVLRRYKLPIDVLNYCILIFLFGSSSFLFRSLIGRPFVIATCAFLIAYDCIVMRRYWILAAVCAFSVLLSHLFLFLWGLGILGVVWRLYRKERREAGFILLYTHIGILVGLILHPDSLQYFAYLFEIFLKIPFSKDLGLGLELYGGLRGINLSAIFLVAISFHLWITLMEKKVLQECLRERGEIVLSYLCMLAFFVLYFICQRATDILWPMSMLVIIQITTSNTFLQKDVSTAFLSSFPFFSRFHWRHLILLFLLVNSVAIGVQIVRHSRMDYADEFYHIPELPAKSRVLNIDWETFPILFVVNDDALYARGMDPSFDYYENSDDYYLLERSVTHESGLMEEVTDFDISQWLQDLQERFDPDYLALRTRAHPVLIRNLESESALSRMTGTGGMVTLYSFEM